MLDFYVYPVDHRNLHLPHDTLVAGYFSEARRGIDVAVSKGMYISAQDYGALECRVDDGQIRILRSRHVIDTARGELLSHTYVTELKGVVLKVRVSVPSDAVTTMREDFHDAGLKLIEIASMRYAHLSNHADCNQPTLRHFSES